MVTMLPLLAACGGGGTANMVTLDSLGLNDTPVVKKAPKPIVEDTTPAVDTPTTLPTQLDCDYTPMGGIECDGEQIIVKDITSYIRN